MCDSVNHTHFPKEDHLPDWVCQDKHGNKGNHVDYVILHILVSLVFRLVNEILCILLLLKISWLLSISLYLL